MGMVLFILACLTGLVAVVGIVGIVASSTTDGRFAAAASAVVAAGLTAILLVLACMTVVQAKNVGVVTSFGKPVDTLEPGLSWKKPWEKVTELDGTWQTDEYNGDDCIYVRIGDGSRSCVTITNRWRIVTEQADTIYGDFRSDDPTESLRDNVVSTQLKAAVQEVLADYNPVASLRQVSGSETQDVDFAPDYDAIGRGVVESMDRRLGSSPLIELQAITVSYVSLADSTQQKIDAFIAEVAQTRIASQQVETNRKIAEANRVLSESVSNDPNVLVSKCLDIVSKGRAPAGFQCWPGTGGSVVLPSGR